MDDVYEYKFKGLATVYNVKCSDGLIIANNAFKHQDGKTVPLLYKHGDVIGYAELSHTDRGVIATCHIEDYDKDPLLKRLVKNIKLGALNALSIMANRLQMSDNRVLSGYIREVSVVPAGANPEAVVLHEFSAGLYDVGDDVLDIFDSVESILMHADIGDYVLEHKDASSKEGEDGPEDSALEHEDNETLRDVLKTFSDEELKAVGYVIHKFFNGNSTSSSDDGEELDPEVFAGLKRDDKKLSAIAILLTEIQSQDENSKSTKQQDRRYIMKTTQDEVFTTDGDGQEGGGIVKQSEINRIFGDVLAKAQRVGSFRHAWDGLTADEQYVIQHAVGITNIDSLFPSPSAQVPPSQILETNLITSWVKTLMTRTRKARGRIIRTDYADMTLGPRAKGYVTEAQKTEESFSVAYRETSAQTIYTKIRFNKDDITDLGSSGPALIKWVLDELKNRLLMELAVAILVGDGRAVNDPDKIREDRIRTVCTDDNLFAVKKVLPNTSTTIDLLDNLVTSTDDYGGSGDLIFFAPPNVINSMLVYRDANGYRMHKSAAELAAAIGATPVKVPVMNNITRTSGADTLELKGVLLDPSDYTLSTSSGLETFNQFDIDYNQMVYLMETRVSGALTKLNSAIVFEQVV